MILCLTPNFESNLSDTWNNRKKSVCHSHVATSLEDKSSCSRRHFRLFFFLRIMLIASASCPSWKSYKKEDNQKMHILNPILPLTYLIHKLPSLIGNDMHGSPMSAEGGVESFCYTICTFIGYWERLHVLRKIIGLCQQVFVPFLGDCGSFDKIDSDKIPGLRNNLHGVKNIKRFRSIFDHNALSREIY